MAEEQSGAIGAAEINQKYIFVVVHKMRPVVTVLADGGIEFANGYTQSGGARAFWEAIARMAPPIRREFELRHASFVLGFGVAIAACMLALWLGR